jgi:hypothetical protein
MPWNFQIRYSYLLNNFIRYILNAFDISCIQLFWLLQLIREYDKLLTTMYVIMMSTFSRPFWNSLCQGVMFYFFIFFYLFRDFWCPTRFPYRMMFVSFNSNTTGTTSGQELLTLPEHLSSPPVLSRVLVAQSLVFCVVFCVKSFVSLSCFWSLCCLSFSHLRILITLLVSSNFS